MSSSLQFSSFAMVRIAAALIVFAPSFVDVAVDRCIGRQSVRSAQFHITPRAQMGWLSAWRYDDGGHAPWPFAAQQGLHRVARCV